LHEIRDLVRRWRWRLWRGHDQIEASSTPSDLTMKKHALILGVRNYQSSMMTSVPFADADAVALGRALEERCGFEAVVLAGGVEGSKSQPTWERVREEFTRLTAGIGDGDEFFFGFCGHGIELDDQGLLLLPEADPEWPDEGTLPLRRIQTFLSRIAAKRAFVHIDACRRDPLRGRGAGVATLPSALSRDLKGLVQERGQGQIRSALLACSEGEQAYESDKLGHGFLTYAVLKSIRGEAWSGGRLTLSALVRHALEEVGRQLKAHGLAGRQTPQYVQEGGAEDWVLGEEKVGKAGAQSPARSALAAWMAEQEAEHERRVAEQKARDAAAAAKQASVKSEFEQQWPVLVKLLGSRVWAPQERRAQWKKFCEHFGVKPLSAEPGDLRWGGSGLEEVLVPWTHPHGLKFLPVPAGQFVLGSESGGEDNERPVTRVTLSRPFWVAEVPVTQALYLRWIGTNPSHFDGATLPVESVTWDEAVACADKAQEHAIGMLPDGYVLRLPTEAEWEYACRAGTTTQWSFGDDESALERHGWYNKNAGGKTHPVGQKLANPWGLKEMHGGVWEWCLDWHGPYPGGRVTDPTGPASGSYRVVRGGSWGDSARSCRSAYRNGDVPGDRGDGLGFRLVLAPRSAS
jgi:formylglycine-generating enzyme required for sulfatase activity